MKFLAFFLVILIVSPVFGQRKGKDEVVTPAFVEGVVYALPRTGINVKVQAVRETFQPGPYAAYAEQLLGIKNVAGKISIPEKNKVENAKQIFNLQFGKIILQIKKE